MIIFIVVYNQTLRQIESFDNINIISKLDDSAGFYYNSKVCNYSYTNPPPYGPYNCNGDTNDVTYGKRVLTDGSYRHVYGITGSSTVISTYYNSWITAINYSNGQGY